LLRVDIAAFLGVPLEQVRVALIENAEGPTKVKITLCDENANRISALLNSMQQGTFNSQQFSTFGFESVEYDDECVLEDAYSSDSSPLVLSTIDLSSFDTTRLDSPLPPFTYGGFETQSNAGSQTFKGALVGFVLLLGVLLF
jgi:hypothetical protein